MKLPKLLAIFVACWLLSASGLLAGVVFEIETTDHSVSPPRSEIQELVAEGTNLKMGISDAPSQGAGDMIYRSDRQEMIVIDHGDKSFMVMDEEVIGTISGQVNSAMAEVEEALKNIPEDQRAMVEKMMKEKMPGSASGGTPGTATQRVRSEVRRTSEKANKNGYPSVKYEVFRGGEKVQEVWVTQWSNIKGGAEISGIFREMADFMNDLMDSMPQTGDGDENNGFEILSEVDGMPVATYGYADDGSLESEANMRSVKARAFDPADFEPPADYRRRALFE